MLFEIYPDKSGKYRWRAKARNGKTVACSGESFASQRNAERAAIAFKARIRNEKCEVKNV